MSGIVDARRRDRNLADLRRMAESFHFGATRVGEPGCEARRSAAESEALLRWAIGEIEAAEAERDRLREALEGVLDICVRAALSKGEKG